MSSPLSCGNSALLSVNKSAHIKWSHSHTITVRRIPLLHRGRKSRPPARTPARIAARDQDSIRFLAASPRIPSTPERPSLSSPLSARRGPPQHAHTHPLPPPTAASPPRQLRGPLKPSAAVPVRSYQRRQPSLCSNFKNNVPPILLPSWSKPREGRPHVGLSGGAEPVSTVDTSQRARRGSARPTPHPYETTPNCTVSLQLQNALFFLTPTPRTHKPHPFA
jgi:hypothetical protein